MSSSLARRRSARQERFLRLKFEFEEKMEARALASHSKN
jgi:hypothetical protein